MFSGENRKLLILKMHNPEILIQLFHKCSGYDEDLIYLGTWSLSGSCRLSIEWNPLVAMVSGVWMTISSFLLCGAAHNS